MLPDFPETKSKLRRRLLQRVDQKMNSGLGIFSRGPRIVLSEGNRLVFQREGDVEREMDFKPVVGELSIPRTDFLTLSPQEIVEKFDRAALEMAQQQHIRVLQEIGRAADEVGNTVDNGQPLGPLQILQALERISIDFDEQGSPKLPTMVIHPDMADAVQAAGRDIESHPELRQKWLNIMQRKREEWRARESRRKLVG